MLGESDQKKISLSLFSNAKKSSLFVASLKVALPLISPNNVNKIVPSNKIFVEVLEKLLIARILSAIAHKNCWNT